VAFRHHALRAELDVFQNLDRARHPTTHVIERSVRGG
jgi:hypothetical protein